MLSSQRGPATPHRSFTGGCKQCLASTAFTCAFKPVRMHTNLARYRTSSRSSRNSVGAIHASGSLCNRIRSISSRQSR